MTSEDNVLWDVLRNEITKDRIRNGLGGGVLKLVNDLCYYLTNDF